MSLSLGIFLFVILVCGFFGFKKGFFSILGALFSLVIAYVAVIVFIKPLAEFLAQLTDFQGVLLYILSGTAIFFVASLAITHLFYQIQRFIDGPEVSWSSRAAGLVTGAVLGVFLGLFTVYVLDIINEARHPQAIENRDPLKEMARDWIGRGLGQLVAVFYPEAAPFAVSFAQSPVSISSSLYKLAKNPQLQQLFQDESYESLFTSGNPEALTKTEEFTYLMGTEDMRRIRREMGLQGEDDQVNKVIAAMLIDGWQGFHRMRNDPEVQKMLQNPDLQRKIQEGDTLALMNDPQVKALTEAFFRAAAKVEAAAE